jgi:hypothetical protein
VLLALYPEIKGFILYDSLRRGNYALLKEICSEASPPCTLSCNFLASKVIKADYSLCPETPEVLNAKFELFRDTSSIVKLAKKYPYSPYSMKALPFLDRMDSLRVLLEMGFYESVLSLADTTKREEYRLYLIAKSKKEPLSFREMVQLPKWYLKNYISKPLRRVLSEGNYDSIEAYLRVLAEIDEERAFRLMTHEVAKLEHKTLGYRLYGILKSYLKESSTPSAYNWLGLSAYILGYIEEAYNLFYKAYQKAERGSFERSRSAFWLYKITRDTQYLKTLRVEDPLGYYSLRLGIKPMWVEGEVWDTSSSKRFYEMGKIVERIAGYNYARGFYLKDVTSAYAHAKDLIRAGNFQKASLVLEHIYRVSSKDRGIPRWWGKMAFPYEKRFFSHLIDSASRTFGVDPLLFVSIVREESRFNPKTTSPAGAIGLAQVMPENVKEFSKTFKKRVKNPYEPKINLMIGAWEISKYLNIFRDYYLALACYNAGCGALNRWLCDYEYERLDFDVFVDVIPYNETRAYVRRVMRSYWVYKSLYLP